VIRRVAITDHPPDEGPGSVCIRCGVAKAWHATPLELALRPRNLPPCRRCGHDEDRHHKGHEPGWQQRCDLIACPCIAYKPPTRLQRWLDRVRGWIS
jgi:hypothetical protein